MLLVTGEGESSYLTRKEGKSNAESAKSCGKNEPSVSEGNKLVLILLSHLKQKMVLPEATGHSE